MGPVILRAHVDYDLAKTNNTRAARRTASPSLDVDKSLTTLPRAESPTVQRRSILADRANAGIQKKQKQKKLSRAQRLRQQKGADRAEAVMDQLEIKKAKSVNRAKSIKARRVWIFHNALEPEWYTYADKTSSRLTGKIPIGNRRCSQLSKKTKRLTIMMAMML